MQKDRYKNWRIVVILTLNTNSVFVFSENKEEVFFRFAHDPDLENQNVNMAVKPTFDLAYHNRAFRDTSAAASVDHSVESREPSDQIWTGSNSNIINLR